MAKTDTIHMRIDPTLKDSVEQLLNQLGLTTTDAINIFLKQVVLTGGLPFPITMPKPNAVTLAAIQESDKIITGQLSSKPQSVNSFFEEMGL